MWIRGFHMDGFGIFHDASCESLGHGATVFLGQNEAGKSTTLDFFRAMLFRFPRKNAKDRRQREPLRGGRHGGRLLLVDGTRDLVLQRSPGPHGGAVSLTDANGVPQPEAELSRLLGSITESLFCNVYAFSLDELQMVGGDSDRTLEQLYGAASGAGNALAQAEKVFDKRTAELFAPGGKNPAINLLLKQFDTIEGKISEARSQTPDFDEKKACLAELEAELAEAQTNSDSLAQRHRRLQAVHEYWGTWVELVDAERALAELPETPPGTPTSPEELENAERDLAAARKARRDREEELAKARAKIKSVALDASLLEHRADIRALGNRLANYRAARERLPVLEEEARGVDQRLQGCLRELGPEWTPEQVASYDRSLAVSEQIEGHAESLAQAAQELREAESRLATARDEHTQAATRLAEARNQEKKAKAALERIPAERCRQFRRERDELVNLAQQLPEWRRQRDDLLQGVAEEARRVDPAWTADDISGFDASTPTQNGLREIRDRLALAKREAELATRDWQTATREYERVSATESAVTETELQVSRTHLRELEKALLRREAMAGASVPASRSGRWVALLVAAVACIGLALAGHRVFWLGLPVLGAIAYAVRQPKGTSSVSSDDELGAAVREHGSALGLDPERVDLDAIQRRREELEAGYRQAQEKTAKQQQRDQAETARKAAEAACAEVDDQWQAMAKERGFGGVHSPETVLSLLPTIEAAQRQVAEATRLADRIKETEARLAQAWRDVVAAGVLAHPPASFSGEALDAFLAEYDEAERALRDAGKRVAELLAEVENRANHMTTAEERVETHKQALETARQAWRNWLTERSFQATLAPDTAKKALSAVKEAGQHMQRLDALAQERTRHEATIEDVNREVASLLAALGRSPDTEDVATLIELLVKENEENDRRQLTAQERQDNANGIESALDSARSYENERQAVLDELLARCGVETTDELERRIATVQERQEMQRVRDERLRALRSALLTTDDAAVRQAFAGTDQAQLPDELTRLAEQVEADKARLKKLHEDRGELVASMEQLANADEVAKLRQEQEGIRAEMTALATEWARATIARRLLDEAKRTFERERQPQVLREASDFFQLLTRGRYHGVFSPLGGDRVLQALMPDQEARTPDQLSRGTVEQLYLALRFGFLTDSAAKGTSLPVIMDEILVNFDPERGKAAAEAIGRLGESHQILYFTCHPGTADLLRKEAGASLIRVTDGAFQPA
jgi:uncharacterized protein YhaN